MARKKNDHEVVEETIDEKNDDMPCPVFLCSLDEMAAAIKVSAHQFRQMLKDVPFESTGESGKINGRWHADQKTVWEYYRLYKKEMARHPEIRRYKPAEPPELSDISTR